LKNQMEAKALFNFTTHRANISGTLRYHPTQEW